MASAVLPIPPGLWRRLSLALLLKLWIGPVPPEVCHLLELVACVIQSIVDTVHKSVPVDWCADVMRRHFALRHGRNLNSIR